MNKEELKIFVAEIMDRANSGNTQKEAVLREIDRSALPSESEQEARVITLEFKDGSFMSGKAVNQLGKIFNVDFGGNYLVQFSTISGSPKITNAMNGWGNNCASELLEQVEAIHALSLPSESTQGETFSRERVRDEVDPCDFADWCGRAFESRVGGWIPRGDQAIKRLHSVTELFTLYKQSKAK